MVFDSTGSTEIGLQLFTSPILPALNSADTLTCFQRQGKVLVERDRFTSFAIGGASSVLTTMRWETRTENVTGNQAHSLFPAYLNAQNYIEPNRTPTV